MRAAWWVLKLVWRAATRVRRVFGPAPMGEHPTEWLTERRTYEPPTATPICNVHDLLEGVPGRAVHDELGRFEQLAKGRRR